MDGYEAMGFDVTQLTQDALIDFLPTDLDGNLLPSNLDLTSHNKAGLH